MMSTACVLVNTRACVQHPISFMRDDPFIGIRLYFPNMKVRVTKAGTVMKASTSKVVLSRCDRASRENVLRTSKEIAVKDIASPYVSSRWLYQKSSSFQNKNVSV